jgi:hypothetical protein
LQTEGYYRSPRRASIPDPPLQIWGDLQPGSDQIRIAQPHDAPITYSDPKNQLAVRGSPRVVDHGTAATIAVRHQKPACLYGPNPASRPPSALCGASPRFQTNSPLLYASATSPRFCRGLDEENDSLNGTRKMGNLHTTQKDIISRCPRCSNLLVCWGMLRILRFR